MDFKRHLFIIRTVEELTKNGSWTGKTHVQKALFLVKALTSVDVPFQFVLYMHGPFSFEIEEELALMKSYSAIEIKPMDGYGVTILRGKMADFVANAASLTPQESEAIESVCSLIGSRGVVDLEKLATAAWLKEHEQLGSADQVATRLHKLKPHIPVQEAKASYDELVTWLS